jgi:hypothetical protein
MNRQELRAQKKQRAKAQKLIKNFLKKYTVEVKKAKKAAKKSDKRNPNEEQKKENNERRLSEVNQIYFEVWRKIQAHIKIAFPLANLDPNFFIDYVIWE